MVTQDDSDSEKSNVLDDEHVNIFLMAYTNKKVEVETCSEFDSSFSASSDDGEYMLYHVLLQNYHMISLQ